MSNNLRNSSSNCLKQCINVLLYNVQVSHQLYNAISKCNFPVRTFSRTSHLAKSRNFYKDLEISQTSTQSEIKNAYYNLSKMHHPDKNKGCNVAAQTFRRINEAYEVLGNVRTRRMYDKGIGSFGKARHSPGTESEIILHEDEVEDDAQTKFYKQHMNKSVAPDLEQRTKVAREFDDWASEKISTSFHQMQYIAQKRRDQEEYKEHALRTSKSTGIVWLGFVILCALGSIINYRHRIADERVANVKE